MLKRSPILKALSRKTTPWLFCVLVSGCASTAPIQMAGDSHLSAEEKRFQREAQASWDSGKFMATAEYHFGLAQAYSLEGKVDLAIEELRAALAYDSKAANIHARLAAEYLKKGELTLALESCQNALSANPKLTDVRLMMAGVFGLQRNYEAALKEYEFILKQDPLNDEASVFKAQILSEQGRFVEARKFLNQAVKKIKDSAVIWYYFAKLEQMEENDNQAIRGYRKALEFRPGFQQASLALGLLFEAKGENKKAIEVYETQIQEKQDVAVSGRLAQLYLKLKQYPQALQLLSWMAVMDPEDWNIQIRIGLVHLQSHNLKEAEAVFRKIDQQIPESDRAKYYLALTLEDQGKWAEALTSYLGITKDSPFFEDSTLRAAFLQKKLFRYEDSYLTLMKGIQSVPEVPSFYFTLGAFFDEAAKHKEAKTTLEKGLVLFPEDAKIRYFYGTLLDKMGQSDEAISQMEKILKTTPDHADALNFIGYTWTVQGVRLKDAEKLLKKALSLQPQNPYILDSVGWNLFRLGKTQEALVHLERAAHFKSDDPSILEHLVEVYARNQMPERAKMIEQRLERVKSDSVQRAPASAHQLPPQ